MATDFFKALLSCDGFEELTLPQQQTILDYYRRKGFSLVPPPYAYPADPLEFFNGQRWLPLTRENLRTVRAAGCMCRKVVGLAYDDDDLEQNYLCGECFALFPKDEDPDDAIMPICPGCWESKTRVQRMLSGWQPDEYAHGGTGGLPSSRDGRTFCTPVSARGA